MKSLDILTDISGMIWIILCLVLSFLIEVPVPDSMILLICFWLSLRNITLRIETT